MFKLESPSLAVQDMNDSARLCRCPRARNASFFPQNTLHALVFPSLHRLRRLFTRNQVSHYPSSPLSAIGHRHLRSLPSRRRRLRPLLPFQGLKLQMLPPLMATTKKEGREEGAFCAGLKGLEERKGGGRSGQVSLPDSE